MGQTVATAEAAQSPRRAAVLADHALIQHHDPDRALAHQVRNAYGLNQVNFGSTTGNGAGQTIAIIDAYDDPNIASDLHNSIRSTVPGAGFVYSVCRKRPAAERLFLALEDALDVEGRTRWPRRRTSCWSSAADDERLISGVSFRLIAGRVGGVDELGSQEFAGESAYDSVFTTPAGHNGVTFVASSGDSGTTEYPVGLAECTLGGRHNPELDEPGELHLGIALEQERHRQQPIRITTIWQDTAATSRRASSTGRTTPDVSFDANPSTGVAVYDSIPYSGFGRRAGTPSAAPAWGALRGQA